MQFKHPEILYALFALLIPILIHLFQLQRFTKVSFTNVSFLKQIELQTRKSSRLKKWLVLTVRLLAFAAIIIAFAQPFFSENDSSKSWHTLIYLDNSLSMQAKGERGEILKRTIQDLAVAITDTGTHSLITNDQVVTDLTKDALKELLKKIDYVSTQVAIKTVLLQSKQLQDKHLNKHQNLFLLSDFQKPLVEEKTRELKNVLDKQKSKINFIQLASKIETNISIDSVSVIDNNLDSRNISVFIKNQGVAIENLSLTAYQEQTIIAKTSFAIAENETKTIQLRIPNNLTNVKLQIDYLDRFTYDNSYYISFQNKRRIKVLLLTKENTFLERIYTKDEFDFTKKNINEVGYDIIDTQDLVIIEGISKITTSLQNTLLTYLENGGHLVLLPTKSDQVEKMNPFFNRLRIGQLQNKRTDSLHMTKIHYAHPILRNVFEKEVKNFQYPKVNTYFEGSLRHSQPILSFENQQAFITSFAMSKGLVYWAAAPFDKKSSNFTKAPLIVPVFYNIAKNSLKQAQLSYRVGVENQVVIPYKLQNDAVLHIKNAQVDFIPRQEIHPETVRLFTSNDPQTAGFYQVKDKEEIIQNIAYNYPKEESNLDFLDIASLTNSNANTQSYDTIKDAFSNLSKEQSSTAYFKWFVLVAILFLLTEILLLKYL